MPQKTETVTLAGHANTAVQAIAYGTLLQLGWELKYAGENMLIAYTHGTWKKQAEEIQLETNDNMLSVSSKMIHGELFDISGKNKKNIKSFLSAVEEIKTKSTKEQQTEWSQNLLPIKEETIITTEKETRQAEEVDKVMNLSKSNLYVTYGIIGINILVFIAMVVSGTDLFAPTGIDVLNWGANFLPLTVTGEWWRLLSCVFVHIGIIHLLFNMYALYMVGIYLEPMLGKTMFIIAYLCTGVFASLASLWWHNPPVPSAGASGAIFGMYGVFLALLSTNLIPKQVRNRLLQSIGVFVIYNLAYGMKSGVDNAAHIGGLISGLVIGYAFYLLLTKQEEGKKKLMIPAIIVLATTTTAFLYIQNESKKADPDAKRMITNAMKTTRDKDGKKFIEKYDEFIEIQNKALAPLSDTALTNEKLADQLKTVSTAEWNKAQLVVDKVKGYDVSETSKKKTEVMQEYITLRKEEIAVLLRLINENKEEDLEKLQLVREKIGTAVQKLDAL